MGEKSSETLVSLPTCDSATHNGLLRRACSPEPVRIAVNAYSNLQNLSARITVSSISELTGGIREQLRPRQRPGTISSYSRKVEVPKGTGRRRIPKTRHRKRR